MPTALQLPSSRSPCNATGSPAAKKQRRASMLTATKADGHLIAAVAAANAAATAAADTPLPTARPGLEPGCVEWLACRLHVSRRQATSLLERASVSLGPAASGVNCSGLTITQHVQPVVDALTAIGFSMPAMSALLQRQPQLLAHSSMELLETAESYVEHMGLTSRKLVRQAAAAPSVLTVSAEDLALRQARICSILSISTDTFRRLAASCPAFAVCDSQEVSERLEFLSSVTGCSRQDMARQLVAYPRLLACSSQRIVAAVGWLKSQSWSAETVSRIAARAGGRVLDLRPAGMRQTLSWLTGRAGLAEAAALKAIAAQPSLLITNLESCASLAKLQFLEQVLGRPLASLVQRPDYLSHSLDGCIAPRTFYLQSRGWPPTTTLRHLCYTAAEWVAYCRISTAQYEQWRKEEWLPSAAGQTWGVKPLGELKPALST